MTTAPPFTAEELTMISDALTIHAGRLRQIYAPKQRQPGTDQYARVGKLIQLSLKVNALAIQLQESENIDMHREKENGHFRADDLADGQRPAGHHDSP